MKYKFQQLAAIVTFTMALPAAADVIYSNFLNTTIPTDFTGVTINVGSNGTLNPFFGGVGVANNSALQPFRTGTGGLDTIKKFSIGDSIDASSGFLATGPGGSQDHVGITFTAGEEGYVGFKLDGNDYGWMRVIFTNNSTSPVTPIVKDWAYDDFTNTTIKAGVIQTDITTGSLTTTTLNPGASDSFTLASVLDNGVASGNYTNSVSKVGDGNVTLKANNTYTGATTISGGKLIVNGDQTSANGLTTVAAGTIANTPVATLAGIGIIGGSVSLAGQTGSDKNGGVLSPTAAADGTALTVKGTTTFGSGSIFAWNMAADDPTIDPGATPNPGSYGQLVGTGAITSSGDAVFSIVLGGGNAFSDNFWSSNKTWNNIFSGTGATTDLASLFSSFSGTGVSASGNVAQGSFSFSGPNTLNYTFSAVPEPTSALAGLLIGAGLLRRRRCAC